MMSNPSLLRRQRRLLRTPTDSRGAAMVEFAIAAPLLAIVLVGVVDISRAYAAQMQLHSALARTLERAQVGSGSGNYDYLEAEAAAAANVPQSNAKLTKWLECDGTKTDFDGSCSGNQQTARYVQLEIWTSYKPFFGQAVFNSLQPDGTVKLTVDDVLRVQ